MKYTSHNHYISSFPIDIQTKLNELKTILKDCLPSDALEVISYNMPAFKLKKVVVYFASHQEHLGFYPTSRPIEAMKDQLSGYKFSKGAVQFPHNQPLPEELIKKIVRYRLNELGYLPS